MNIENLLDSRFQRGILIFYFIISDIMYRNKHKRKEILLNLKGKFINLKTFTLTLILNFLIFLPQVRDIEQGRLEYIPNFLQFLLLIISIFGCILKIYSQFSLKKPRGVLNINKEVLVTDGPYYYVRHPGYLCNLIVWFPLLFLNSHNPLLTIIFMMVYYGIFNEKITIEEDDLKSIHGKKHIEYVNQVPYKVIPFIW